MKTMMWMIALILIFGFMIGCSSSNSTNNSNTAPATPTNLVVSQADRFVVHVAWSDNSANEDSFIVQRSVNQTGWQNAGGAGVNGTFINDGTTLADSKYYYRVSAENSYGSSDQTASGAYYTWPAIYDFSSDQTGHFTATSLEGSGDYHTWTWDNAVQAGKLTITNPQTDQHIVSVVADDSLANNGWFESKVKIANWYGTSAKSEIAFFVEKDPTTVDDAVGLIINQDSLRFGYYRSGGASMTRLVETSNAYFTANAWHTVKFLHTGDNWEVTLDGHTIFLSTIGNVANGNYKLIQEWQFDRGDGPDNQNYWLDDVANPSGTPVLVTSAPMHVIKTAARPVIKK
jgi:hypothetical protein